MAESSLQDRLRDHAKAFDGLLSLIPAKTYYGEDTSDQWQKKKQTKQEAAAARRGKLDPDSELNRNAKEVMDERAKNKRKLQEMQQQDGIEGAGQDANDNENDDGPFEAMDGVEAEKPGEGLRKKAVKKQKLDENEDQGEASSGESKTKTSRKEEKRASKRERKADKRATKKAKRADELATPATPAKTGTAKEPAKIPSSTKKSTGKKNNAQPTPAEDQPSPHLHRTPEPADADKASTNAAPTSKDIPAAHQDGERNSASSDTESDCHSQTFDEGEPAASIQAGAGEAASATTSVSSTAPPSEKAKHIKIPADTTALRARLAAKIEALRAARKADGPDGKPIRTRQELIESRRAKEAQRKTHKKELRRLARIEESRKREEALASNSPGVMSPAVELEESTGNFSFGRVVFGDGSQMSHDLSYVRQQGKKKGPSDAKTALLKVQNQKKRLEELDADKRAEITDKEAWLTARRRLEGDKIRDDEAMLKKSVKRKEAAKKKSDKAWRERAQGVELAQKERQKKREDNLRKRRDEKLAGKAGKAGKKKGGAKKKKGGRPGFEGSFGVGGRKK